MRKELCIVKPIDFPYIGQTAVEFHGARFCRFEFCTDQTDKDSLRFPFGAMVEVCVSDGAVLAAIARVSISPDELSFVNLDTWRLDFKDSSTKAFFEDQLRSAKDKLVYSSRGHLDNLCRAYGAHSALRALKFEEVPHRVMIECGLRSFAHLKRAECLGKLDKLLDYVADDPFFSEYKFPH